MAKTTAVPQPENDWRAEEDLRTMKRAAEIHKDRKRLKLMEACMKKEMAGLKHASKYAKLMQNDAEGEDEED